MIEPPPPDYALTRPRDEIDDYFLINYPHLVFIPVLIYLWFVKVYGPKYMAHRKPYELTNVMRIYNFVQVLFNGYIVSKVFIIRPQIIKDYSIHYCHYFNTEDNPSYVELVDVCYLMLYTKYIDYLDSVFIILKKNFRQLSFLHVYHHASVVIMVTYSISDREGLTFAVALLNSAIHVMMYAYFLASSFPSLKPWITLLKPTITKIQIVQFVLQLGFLMWGWHKGCSIGYKMTLMFTVPISAMLILFINFYVKNYIIKKTNKK